MTTIESKGGSEKAATVEHSSSDEIRSGELAEGAESPPSDFQAEVAAAEAQQVAIAANTVNQPASNNTVYAFASEFYKSKQPPSESFRSSFGNLEPGFSQEDHEALLKLALAEDVDLNRTLLLAEFLLETTTIRDYRDQLIHFVQAVASNTGSLVATSRSDEFQRWLDESRASSNVLERFVTNIERIRQVDSDKPLPQRQRNNLISIAAIWLFTRQKIEIPQLIKVLRAEGMNLDGESGPHVTARAFAYVASMIKSTTKRRFAYFLDWTDKTRELVETQLKHEKAIVAALRQQMKTKEEELTRLENELAETRAQNTSLTEHLERSREETNRLSTELRHKDIHHGAEKSSTEADQTAFLREILGSVGDMRIAMSKEKLHVVEYNLEVIEDKLKAELS